MNTNDFLLTFIIRYIQRVTQNTLIVIVAMAAALSSVSPQDIEYAHSTGKLIDTSTGESTELKAGTIGETAPNR